MRIPRNINVFENGLKHVHYHVPQIKSMCINFLVNAGSADEYRHEQHGAAHFLEHMLFNGSEKYRTSTQADQLITSLGGYQNASTFYNWTQYYVTAPSSSFDSVMDVLTQRVFFPLLESEMVEKERGIIQEEIKMGLNDPITTLFHQVDHKLFEGTSYAHDVIGDKESVGNMSAQVLRQFHDDYYSTNNVVLVTYGDLAYEEVEGIVEKYISPINITRTGEPNTQLEDFKVREVGEEMDVITTFKLVSSLAPKPKDLKEYLSGMVFRTALGRGKGSLLHKKLVSETGLLSEVSPSLIQLRDFRVFYFIFGADQENISQVMDIYSDTISGFQKEYGDREFLRSVGFLKGEMLKDYEEIRLSTGVDFPNIERVNQLLGWDHSLEELYASVGDITKEDVYAYADSFNDLDSIEGIVRPKAS